MSFRRGAAGQERGGTSGGIGASAGHRYVFSDEYNAFLKAYNWRRGSFGKKGEFGEARRGLSRRVEETMMVRVGTMPTAMKRSRWI